MRAAGLTRTLQTNDCPTRLARALQELGRLVKTLYVLRYIDDEAYRSRILIQLNRSEGRHQLARVIFHGRRGELRQRYREGQEDQLSALGLTVNLVVLWNTIYMDASLNQLTSEGYEVRPEDVARLSPLGLKHINMLGRYAFTLPDFVARGELRRADLQLRARAASRHVLRGRVARGPLPGHGAAASAADLDLDHARHTDRGAVRLGATVCGSRSRAFAYSRTRRRNRRGRDRCADRGLIRYQTGFSVTRNPSRGFGIGHICHCGL